MFNRSAKSATLAITIGPLRAVVPNLSSSLDPFRHTQLRHSPPPACSPSTVPEATQKRGAWLCTLPGCRAVHTRSHCTH
uniref:Hypothetical secreted protein n=1 Tax=Ornithodoros coriaceus TaxID=92741 RepID=B2D2C6_ORNCO|nr:hypothetical secreted protein [Ornithodoros coriaceus]